MPTIITSLVPSLATPELFAGGAAVIIDLLRASTTITRALEHGAAAVVPVLEPELAITERERLVISGQPRSSVVLGGERGGVLIPGFDLDNSPARYAREVVAGRTIVFTTTNGTRALMQADAGGATPIFIGCLNNRAAVVEAVPRDRHVHLLCAGTRGEVSQEDVLCAGAMAELLIHRGFELPSDDQTRLALELWLRARSEPGGVTRVLRGSRGGRNLHRIGFASDIDDCARLDQSTIVPEFRDGVIRSRRPGC